jgi:hypothetical protein
MEPLEPDFLLDHPELVEPEAPWCTRLDGVELALVLLALPWLAGNGLRPADFERRLTDLGREIPVGRLYFQRIRRSVRKLEETGALRGHGAARSRRYVATPAGLAVLIVNLAVPADDPTIDGSEFELKRALASMAGHLSGRLASAPGEIPVGDALGEFFAQAERLSVLGRPLLSEDLVDRAFDVRELIVAQRRVVSALLESAQRRLEPLASRAALARSADLALLARRLAERDRVGDDPLAEALVGSLAAQAMPWSVEAAVERYRAYLAYLDSLASLHGRRADNPASAVR